MIVVAETKTFFVSAGTQHNVQCGIFSTEFFKNMYFQKLQQDTLQKVLINLLLSHETEL